MKFSYNTSGVCSRQITFDLEGDTVKNVHFAGGCPGNLRGICSLAEGMEVDDLIKRVKGIRCGGKPTSCPDQLSIALSQAVRQYKKQA